jgi:hypothetical protein
MQHQNLIKFFIILLGGIALGFVAWTMILIVNHQTEKIARTFPAFAGLAVSAFYKTKFFQKRF